MASLAPADVLVIQNVFPSRERLLRPKLARVQHRNTLNNNFEILGIATLCGTALTLPRPHGRRPRVEAKKATTTCLHARGGEAGMQYSYSNAMDVFQAVEGSNLRTTIKITRGVLDPSNMILAKVYREMGSCVAVLDKEVDAIHGAQLEAYFETKGITFVKLILNKEVKANEDGSMTATVAMAQRAAQVHQGPLLVVGGETMAGFAAALLSQNTPHILLCTSDIGVSVQASKASFGHLIFNLPAVTL